ncbi:MAG: phage portal protein, partial [Pseudomonadota bacterium]
AKRGRQVIANHTVGWGINSTPVQRKGAGVRNARRAIEIWQRWAETTQCDFERQRDIYGLQKLAIGTIARDGEVLIRRRRRPSSEGLHIPLQLQVLECDYLDTMKDLTRLEDGGFILQGIEFDKLGRRRAYWLFDEHPGSQRSVVGGGSLLGLSKRVDAKDVLHVYRIDRPGQVRGISWFAPAIVTFKDSDEYEDATLVRQKIAACFSAFVTDVEGDSPKTGTNDDNSDPATDQFEPGMIVNLPLGKDIKFSNPPTVQEHESFSGTLHRKMAAGLGITVEDLTGDYRGMPFSAARMSRISHWFNVHDWQHQMLIPQMCNPIWDWAMEAGQLAGQISEAPPAKHMPKPMPMLEPEKEGLALQRLVRSGALTPSDMIRRMGGDPDTHWDEYAADIKLLREKGIVLDSDASKVSQTGQTQTDSGDGSGGQTGDDAGDGEDPDDDEDPDEDA